MNRGPDGEPFVPPGASRFATAAGVRMHVTGNAAHPLPAFPEGR
ncbi:hypothetical protein [Thauera sinica]|uniref:Uncharacterized protein n=1 Tax=Thauera sinica TaxID=2665146 RepID=A0ABW1AKQ6_9RHOO|nr:hypothetical protein [Thauera sp. K11]